MASLRQFCHLTCPQCARDTLFIGLTCHECGWVKPLPLTAALCIPGSTIQQDRAARARAARRPKSRT